MDSILDRIAKLPPKKLALLAAELYERSQSGGDRAEPIAVTAVACRLPGGVDTPEAFWAFLDRGGDAVAPFSDGRLALTGSDRKDVNLPGADWGAFLSDVTGFDAELFGVSAKEAESMDPQQRLLLEVCWEALENTGQPLDSLQDSRTGVFVGLSGLDYALISQGASGAPNGYAVTGVANAVAAGRIAYVFGLNGPATTLDTACSSSASAIHLACQSLRLRECDQAIAGGVNLILTPSVNQTVASLQALAKDGRCKAFSADADGFGRGEGCVMIVLKRLSDALADGSPILGVLRASAWNQDGRSGGLTAPNGAAQETVIRAALARAGLTPDEVSYLEAHGTGTALGDPIEILALAGVFRGRAEGLGPLTIGSLKSNVGHLEAAAGVASVLKVLLALKHERIPASLHCETPTPRVDWAELPLRVGAAPTPWRRGERPRVAGVSAYGLSGTNVHLLVGEPPAAETSEPPAGAATLLTLSAKSSTALRRLAERMAERLERNPDVDLRRLAASANLCRAAWGHRLALVMQDAASAARELRTFAAGAGGQGIRSGFAVKGRPPRVVATCSGEARPADLHVQLLGDQPAYARAWAQWLEAVAAAGGDASADAGPAAQVGRDIALAALWRSWGIRPASAHGEGPGAISAAAISGAIDLAAAARLALQGEAGAAPRPAKDGSIDRELPLEAGSWDALQAQLADLFVAGAEVDWTAFHRDVAADPSLLPNYPFQHARFWPAAAVERRAKASAQDVAPATDPEDVLYRVAWRPAEASGGEAIPAPAELVSRLMPRLPALGDGQDWSDSGPFQARLNRFAVDCILAAFADLNPKLKAGDVLPEGDLAGALGADPSQGKLLVWLADALDSEGAAERVAAGWRLLAAPQRADLEGEIEAIRRDFPRYGPETDVAARAVHLGEVLSGKIKGVELMFPGGSFALMENLYRNGADVKVGNSVVGEAIETLAACAGRRLRVLEIGAGTGSTSSVVLQRLPADCEYVFTDISPAFLAAARQTFRGDPRLQYAQLDIESAEDVARLAHAPFDLVVASNVLHATRRLDVTMRHVKQLLAQDGVAVLLEAVDVQPITHVTIGTIEGWQLYEDVELRPAGPLLPTDGWIRLLEDLGFAAAAPPNPEAFGELGRHLSVILAQPAAGRTDLASERKVVLVHRGDGASAAPARAALEAEGCSVREADLETPGARPTPMAGEEIVFLHAATDPTRIVASAEAGLADLLSVARGWVAERAEAGGFWIVTRGAWPVAGAARPDAAALWGFGRVLASENPDGGARLVDLETERPDWPALARAIARGSAEPELAFAGGRSFAPQLEPAPLPRAAGAGVSPDASYLVTGAFGALGALTVQWLAEQGARSLFAVGRRAPEPEAEAALARARSLGAVVEVLIEDVGDPEAVDRIFARIDAAGRPLRGIVHSATALSDAAIPGQSPESLHLAFGPKAAGAWLLHERTLRRELDFFLIYSSLASVVGAAGQANYAAANAFADALAHHRAAQGLPATSINWGIWRISGARVERDFRETWASRGGTPFTVEEGLDALARMLAAGEPQIAALKLDWAAARNALKERAAPPIIRRLLAAAASAAAAPPAAPVRLADVVQAKLQAATAAEAPGVLTEFIRLRAAELLNLDPALIRDDLPLMELGLDSLIGLELRNDLQVLAGRPMPSTLFFDCPSLSDLSAYLTLTLRADTKAQAEAPEAGERERMVI